MNSVKLETKTDDYRLYHVAAPELPKNTFIVCSDSARQILYSPHLAGKKLQDLMDKMSEIFVKAVTEKALKGEKKDKIIEFVLLSGALYYNLNYGFKKVNNIALPQCFLGIKRQRVEGTEGTFIAVSTYENFESLVDDAIVICGDTIASGATIIRAINDLEKAMEEKDFKMKKLIVLSLAGSTEGGRRLKKLEERLRIPTYYFVAEQLFHVMPDGTDLRFLREDSIMPDETKEYTFKTYGPVLGKEMKCAVFDWGTRCKNPQKHYHEFMEFANDILKQNVLDAKGTEKIKRMRKEIEEEITKTQQTL
ncbi:MAG: hypothetical protein ABII22_00545 [Candidatus Micrarchaeota archaeon]